MSTVGRYKAIGSYGTIGIEIVLSILFGLFVGTRLDNWLHTSPWMSILWFAFGCAAAGRSLYRGWKEMQAAARREEAEEGNPAQQFPDQKAQTWAREEREERERQEQDGEQRSSEREKASGDEVQEPVTTEEKSDSDEDAEKRDD